MSKTCLSGRKVSVVCCFVLLFVPLAVLVGVASVYIYRAEEESSRTVLFERMRREAALARQNLESELGKSISAVTFLSNPRVLHEWIETGGFEDLQSIYSTFSETTKAYDQIRLLGPSGWERVRVNYSGGRAHVVAEDDLQFKGDREYFLHIAKLSAGEIYVSAFDLNIEHGEIERPFKPVIRLGTPLRGEGGGLEGVVVLNLLGADILRAVAESSLSGAGELMMLNGEGYWLHSANSEDEWGFMFRDRKDVRFGNRYPDEWERIAAQPTEAFATGNGLFFHTSISLGNVCNAVAGVGAGRAVPRTWHIVSHVPASVLAEARSRRLEAMLAVVVPVLLAFALVAYFIARFRARSKQADMALVEQSITFERFIPKEFLQLMGKGSLVDVHRSQSSQHDITVMFSDIRSYTKLSEAMSPSDVFRFLNDYFTMMGGPIAENRGFIDKYIGDAIMALFPGSPEDALKAAIAIKAGLERFNAESPWTRNVPVRAGFGLHFGDMTLGSVGTRERQQTTVIGDTVNLASRIESATKMYGVDIVLSDAVYGGLADPEAYKLREIDTVRVKGKEEPVTFYEAFDADPPDLLAGKTATREKHREAIRLYKAGEFEKALALFEACVAECPEDGVPKLYIKRCNTLMRVPPGPGWAGVSTL